MVLHVPIALPGSGKTTWTTRVLKALRVSTDDIRVELSGGEYVHTSERNVEVFGTFHARVSEALHSGYDVIADATNLHYRHREALLHIAQEHTVDVDVHYIVFKNVAEAVARNAQREVQRVPDDAMVRFVGLYEKALRDIVDEPYTYITYIESVS